VVEKTVLVQEFRRWWDDNPAFCPWNMDAQQQNGHI
jgi:hypothetical protein